MAIAERYWKKKTAQQMLEAAHKAARRARIYQEQSAELLALAARFVPMEKAALERRLAELEQPNLLDVMMVNASRLRR